MKISDLVITGTLITLDIADKIILHHIYPMIAVENVLGKKVWASSRSGYRPIEWEYKMGRSGSSQHTFQGKGAVDWTCEDFRNNKQELIDLVISMTDYKRIAIYDGFIHCDYKGDERLLFSSDAKSNWKLIKKF